MVTFPLAPLDLRTELDLGGWTDISGYAMQRDGTSPPVSIKRGRPSEQASPVPSSMSAQWNNRSGNLSPRNPNGTWYGLLGRNTPVRVSVPAAGASYLRMEDDVLSCASMPGSGVLPSGSVSVDIRLDMDISGWQPAVLASWWDSAERAWAVLLNGAGTITFAWTTDGTLATLVTAQSTMPLPLGPGCLQVTLNHGTGAVTFATAPTGQINGTFTALGQAPAATGSTSLFASAAAFRIGCGAVAAADFGLAGGMTGAVFDAQVRLGIGGSVKAEPAFSSRPDGTLTWTDAESNTWTCSGSALVSGRSYRGHFECTALPQRWDSTGADVWCPVQAKGVLQRLQQGSSPLPSAMRRFVTASAAAGQWGSVLGYWPAEDNAGATQVASGLPGGLAMAVSGTPAFQGQAGSKSADSRFTCSAQLGQVQSSSWIGSVPQSSGPGGVFFLLYIPSGTPAATILSLAPLSLVYSTASGGTLQLLFGGGSGGETTDISGIDGIPLLVQMWQTGNISPSDALAVLTVTPVLAPQNISQVTTHSAGYESQGIGGSLQVNPAGAALGPVILSHVLAVTGTYSGPSASPYGGPSSYAASGYSASVPPAAMVSAAGAWFGETAANRLLRLCAENGIAGRVYGYPDLTAPMGAQGVDTLANLVQYCELTDRGQVYEPAEALGIGYRTLGSLCSQAAQLALDYAQAHLGDGSTMIAPTDDDQYTLNDVTVQRSGGSSAQVQVTAGTMSIQPPPAGVGPYDTQVTTYGAWDKDIADIASWIAWAGTCDQERYPAIPLSLSRTELAPLLGAITGMRLGGYFTIANLISQMPPGTVKQLLYGYSELLGGFHWRMALNAVPEVPYEVAVAGTAHAATAASKLAAGVSSTAATLSVDTTAGNLWTTAGGDFPFGILVSGEQMTITSITGSSSPQSFSVTRSVNGVVKAQLADAAVTVADVPVAALAGNR